MSESSIALQEHHMAVQINWCDCGAVRETLDEKCHQEVPADNRPSGTGAPATSHLIYPKILDALDGTATSCLLHTS